MKRALATLLAGALLATSCAGGGPPPTTTTTTTTSDLPTASVPLEDHALTFVPEEDSFSFENFGGGEPPADLTVNMARRLYGDDQVCQEVVDNRCTPYPVILQLIQQVNRSMRGGLCEGLAVLSLRLEGDTTALTTFQQVQQAAQLVKEDPALLSEIAYWYVTQFSPEVQERATAYRTMSPADLARILMDDFASAEAGDSHTGYTIGIYSDHGGHAVTPYRVIETADGYRIYIYDSNWPTTERWIDVGSDGTWVYALAATNPSEEASAWSGGVGTMELTPMGARQGPFTCSFCPQSNSAKSGTMLTVAATGGKQMTIQIETESGDRLGYYDDGFVNEIEGATYRYLISGPSTADPVLVFLPPEVEVFSADVGQIEVPAPEDVADATELGETPSSEPPEQAPEEATQTFSLLLLNEEKSIQVEAVVEEPVEDPDPGEPAVEEVSVLEITETSIDVGDLEEATISIAVEAVEIKIELEDDQTIEIEFAPEDVADEAIEIDITDVEGEVVAEVEIDLTERTVEEAPTVVEIVYNEDTGEITQEEEEIEAWVASDAEYFQAVVEDRVEEVLGAAWAEEVTEDAIWEDEETESLLTEVMAEVEDDYWEDDYWEETTYDEEYFEEVEEEAWKDDSDNPLVLAAPVLVGQAPVSRSTVVRFWTTVDSEALSEVTTRTETYQDPGGTLTEIWTDTQWEILETTSEWTETQTETGTLNTYSDAGNLVEETLWETATLVEASQESSVITDAWTTSDLVATDQDCLFRQNQLEQPPFAVSLDASSLGSDRTARLPLSASSMKAASLRYRAPSSATQSMSTVSTPNAWLHWQWDNDTDEKPSGCATPGNPSVVQREDNSVTTSVATTETLEASGLSWIPDGLWYDAITTVDTTVKTFTDVTTVEWSDGYTAITYSDDYDVTSTSQSVSGWTNDCEVTGPNDIYSWTGMGDWCIVDSESGDGNDDDITFTLTETKTVQITAATNLTCDGWPGNNNNGENDYGDPYVYLYDSNNNLIESDDDDGCTCGNNCPDSGNCWDSLITRELTAGTYTVKARVYSVGTGGWYKLTIDTV